MTRRFLAGMLVVALLAALPGRAEAAFPEGSRIVRAELDGMVASITYSAAEEAELIAAVYTEDGKELLASGRRTVSAAEDATADLRLTGTRPEYALLRVFLLGREDHAPLCASCCTSAFSCPPEEIEATEPKDFEADRVLDMGTGGFAVVKQGVVLLRAEENAAGQNRLLARDDEAVQYKIGTPNETIRNLRAGQIVALEYERGKLLLLRVRKLQTDEDAVTLYGDDNLQLNDVFDLIKLDVTAPAEGFSRENDGQNTREGKILLDGDGLTGEAAATVAAAAQCIGTTEPQMRLEASPGLSGTVTTDGAAEASIPLGSFCAVPAEGVRVRFSPVLHLRTDAAQTVHWTMKGTVGFACDSTAGQWEEVGEPPEIVLTADQPGEAEVRVTWHDLKGIPACLKRRARRKRAGWPSSRWRCRGAAGAWCLPRSGTRKKRGSGCPERTLGARAAAVKRRACLQNPSRCRNRNDPKIRTSPPHRRNRKRLQHPNHPHRPQKRPTSWRRGCSGSSRQNRWPTAIRQNKRRGTQSGNRSPRCSCARALHGSEITPLPDAKTCGSSGSSHRS